MAEPSIWRRLARLFKSGPIVRHKIARGEAVQEPVGTASSYKKQISSLYTNSLASYGQYERLQRYADFCEMCYTPEISSALNIYADEVCVMGEDDRTISIQSKNPEIKEILEELFFDIIDIEFNLWHWVRNLCKYGDFILIVDATEGNGIVNLLPIPINEIERQEGYDPKDPFAVRFLWTTQGNKPIENWQIIHFRLLGDDSFLPYGYSILEPARRIWRQLVLIEDAMLVYRIVRSPERRVFKIPVDNITPDAVEQHIEEVKTGLKRNQIVDPTTGRVDMRYNPLSVDEDYFLPQRGDRGPTIESLPGGQFTGDIDDVQYIQAKMFAALGVPRAYLGYDDTIGSKATLAQEDVRFAQAIRRIQKIVIAELNKIAIIHLFIMGYSDEDLANFEIKMANPSYVAEQQRLELWRMRLEVAGVAQEGILDRDTVRKRILGLNDREIARIKEGRKFDKLEDNELENMAAAAAPGGEGGGDAGGGDFPGAEPEEPGADQLPDQLGGESDGETTPESVYGEPVLEKNVGSAGSSAEIAVDKGKDLFSTGEDQFELVFGTEKQAASDPFDRRYMRRAVTRPMSEKESILAWFDHGIEESEDEPEDE
jgi:hypothetical protein